MELLRKIQRPLWGTLIFILGISQSLSAQNCDPTVPTFNVDLSASPNMNWTSPPVSRNGNCCGTTNPDRCLEFVITLHPSAIAINFQITGGAVPPGALFYQIDCGPVTPVGSPICLDGPGPHTLTFCKPGNNINEFTITSYSEPIIGPDISLNAACQGFIYGNYYNEASINWTSVGPGAPGTYDNLLSCTAGCDTTFVTAPGSGAPAFVDYEVCGMDVGGCNPNPICDTIRVTFIPPVEVTISSAGPFCAGSTTTLTANVSGGSGPYNILWSTAETTSSITAGAGAYSVQVTDTSGCLIATDNINLVALPLPNVDAGADQMVCDGDQVTLSGSGAATYTWDNGITDGVAFTPAVGTTTYTVTGTDANGCVNTDQVDVTVNPLPIVDAGADQTVCDGDQVTLSGSGAATYAWDNGITDGVAFTPAVGTTTYTVTGTDANGCVNTDQVDVTVNPLPIVDAGADQTVCEGTQVTLSGSGASTYAWDNGVTDGVAFTPAVGTTTYTVTGTDANGCVNTDQVDVTVNPLPIVDAGADQTVCEGTQVTLSGSGAATYTWDNGITDGVAFTPAVGTTTYTVTGTDANGCVNTDQVDVTVNPLPIVDAGADQTVCEGDQVTLSGSGAATYAWDNGITDGVAFTPAVGTTTYTVTGTDANGCVNTDQVDVTVNPLPIVDAGADQTVCEGDQVTLSGSGAATYTWDNGVTDGVAFTPAVGTTTYTVTGTDANGCVNTDQVDVTVNPLPIVDAGPDQTVCEGDQVTLSGSGAATYAWDNGITDGVAFTPAVGTTTYTVTGTDANGCVNTDQVDVTVNPLPIVDAGADQTVCDGDQVTLSGSGAATYAWDNGVADGVAFTPAVGTTTYTVTGTDANGCVNTDQVDVTVNPLPIVDAGADQTVCDGDQVTLNGSGAATYAWDNGVTDGVAFTPAVGTTTYTVTGTDANGCVNTDQVDVTVNPLPIVDAGADQTVCDGDQVTLSGSGAATYAWDNGVTDGVAFTPAVGTTTYTVTGTDANGCMNTDQVDVTVNPLPNVDAGADQTVCEGTQVTLSGSGASTYAWDNGITDGVAFTPAVGTTTYTVTGTDANGCVNTDQVDVIVNPLPIVDAGADQTVCEGTQVTLSGSGAATYTWDNGITDGVAFTPAVGTTTYTVTGTDANGCVNTDQVDVIVNPLPIVDAGADQTVCEGDQVTLSGSGASTYAWDNGITDGVAFTPAVGTTTYTVTGTDANGCVNTDQVDVTVNPLPIVDAGVDQTVCEGDQVTLSGSGASTYAWDNGITDGVAFTPAVGTTTYTVTGTDANGCVNTDQVDVTVNPLPIVDAGADQTVCEGTQVTLSGSGAATYAWDNGVTDGVAFTPAVGTTTYTVTGTDANGCVNTDQVDVTVNPLPIVDAGADQTVCEGDQVTLSGSGASTYAWDNGITDGVAFTPAVGTTTYTVTGTDANGCVNTDQVDVTVNPLPIVDAGVDQTVCEGTQVTLSGSGAATYTWDNGITDGVAFTPAVGTTTYTVTGTDANGCVNTDQVDVTVNPLPIVDAGPDQTVCEGTQVTLSGSGASTYAWDNGITDGVAFTPALGTTTYTVNGTDANGCVNTDQVDVTVNPLPIVSAGEDFAVCEGLEVTLTAVGSPNLVWGGNVVNGVAFVPNGTQEYVVYDTLSTGCSASDTIEVVVNDNPIVSAPDAEICPGEGVTLNGAGAVTYSWNNGVIDGETFYPTQSGEYIVTGTDANGCEARDTSFVRVLEAPIVAFKILDLSLTTIDPTTGFQNQTTGASSYEWNFGDGSGINTEFEPTHTFPDDEPGEYEIILTAYSNEGCPAQAVKYVHVFSDYTIYVPNAFTPDGSGVNEIFKPVMDGFDPNDYELIIFNRWGDIIFESHNMEVGWDGTYAGQDFQTQDGVYTWKITAGIENTNDTKIFVGHVSLLK